MLPDFDPLQPPNPIAEHHPGKDIVPDFEVDADGDVRIRLSMPTREHTLPWENWDVDAVAIARIRKLTSE